MIVDQRPGTTSAGAVDLVELASMVWCRKWLVICVVGVFLAGGFAYLKRAIPVYRASTRLVVERQNTPGERQATRFDPTFVATQAEIVQSRAVIERAVRAHVPKSWSPSSDPIETVTQAIRAKQMEGTNVVQVSFDCADETEAVTMLAAVVEGYRAYLRDSADSSESPHTEFFSSRNERELRGQLAEKEAEYIALSKDSPLVELGRDRGQVHKDYLVNLGKGVTEAKKRRVEAENQSQAWQNSSALASAAASPGHAHHVVSVSLDLLPEAREAILSLPGMQKLEQVVEVRQIQAELQEARRWEGELGKVYGSRHPDVLAARSEIRSLQARLEQKRSAIPAILAGELEVARSHEQELESMYQEELKKVKQLQQQQMEERQLLDTIDRLRSVHDSLLASIHTQQLLSASAANGQGVIQVKSISPPQSSNTPIWPKPKPVLATCAVLGLCVGLGLAVSLDAVSRHSRVDRPSA